MAGAGAVKPLSESCPCLCVDSSIKRSTSTVSYFYRNVGKRRRVKQQRMVHLRNSFLDSWSAKMVSSRIKRHKLQRLVVVDELGGQYEDTFNDVKMVTLPQLLISNFHVVQNFSCLTLINELQELVDYFTFKAVRTVLEQLYEMNPPQYKWFNK